ncbi:MAG: NAD-binding protein [Candidatus Magasanikbacteria bacterium]|nr:NAD-binding protein [Candidatus Magasanikbacteria bacterium]
MNPEKQNARRALVIGSGHLALQTARLLTSRGWSVATISSSQFDDRPETKKIESSFEHASALFNDAGIATAHAVCIVDDEDRRNLQLTLVALALNKNIPIAIALWSDALAEHITHASPLVYVCNPAAIATAHFIAALEDKHENLTAVANNDEHKKPAHPINKNGYIAQLLIAFALVIALGALFFKLTEGTTWLDSVYLIVTVITSVNFGDAALHNYTVGMKFVRIVLLLGVQFFILLTFSFIIDHIIKRRVERFEFGRRRYTFKNHVILAGLGRVGYHVVRELRQRNHEVVIVEHDEHNRFLDLVRNLGAQVFIGDASLTKNLVEAGVERAAALFSVIDDDLANLEISMKARSLNSALRVIVRIFDTDVAETIKNRFNIHRALSTSALAAEHIAERLEKVS